MPRRKPDSTARTPAGHMRRNIAATAARLMADDGLTDYGSAKRKAAKQLRVSDTEALPTNEEIDVELRGYQALFHGEEHKAHLRNLRTVALEIMELLAEFRPCLTGHVLDGTAGRYSRIELELFADSSKDVEIFLLSRNLPYAIDEIPRRGQTCAETRLRIEWDDIEVQIMVFPITAERLATRNANGHRARLPAVAELLANTQ